MDRYWFFTWRTYGTWLPGEDGFVGYYRDNYGHRTIDNVPGEPASAAIPALQLYAAGTLCHEPTLLTAAQARTIASQLHETARYRGREIDAVAVLVNHVHLVFGTRGDPDPDRLLADWKAYASRALNHPPTEVNAPARRVWWAESGSTRPLHAEERRLAAIRYVRDQVNPLIVWLSDEARTLVGEPGA